MSIDAIYDITLKNDPVTQGPIERLESIWITLIQFGEKHPAEYEFVFNVPQKVLRQNVPLMKARNRSYMFALDLARKAFADGLIMLEPRIYVQIAWSIIHGLVTLNQAIQLLENRTLESLVQPAMALLHPRASTNSASLADLPPVNCARRSARAR